MTDTAMSVDCTIATNPDISGIGVRTAIYAQNILCFLSASWALWDGTVSQGELDYAETLTTTNLVLAFAILISSIVQARTLGMTNYHGNIVLLMSWMNNTNAFVYFILYIHHKLGLPEGEGRVDATWGAWVQHIKDKFLLNWGAPGGRDVKIGADSNEGTTVDRASRQSAKVFIKRFVLVLGSLHLTLMAAMGAWLWSDLMLFGLGTKQPTAFKAANKCAVDSASVAILGRNVPFRSPGLRIFSMVIYVLFLAPGLNLIVPMFLFLGAYFGHWQWTQSSATARTENQPDNHLVRRISESLYQYRLRTARHWVKNFPKQLRAMCASAWRSKAFPAFVGLGLLLAINLIFIIDIELTLRRNHRIQDPDQSEDEWGFGQILAILLLLLPMRDLVEAILARRLRQRQNEIDEDVREAMRKEDFDAVIRAFRRGCDLPVPGSQGVSEESAGWMLEQAIRAAHQHITEFYARLRGGHINRRGQDGLTAIMLVSQTGDESLVKLLLENPDVNINLSDAKQQRTALMFALEHGHNRIVTLLLNRRPDIEVNKADGDGNTALMLASKAGSAYVVQLLLRRLDIDLNSSNGAGQTACLLAFHGGHISILELFVGRHDLNVNMADGKGLTLLLLLAKDGNDALVKLLLRRSEIEPNAATADGDTALMLASQNGHEAIAGMFLKRPDIHPNAANKAGYTALMLASQHGHETIAGMLLERVEIQPNAATQGGDTALIFASLHGHEAIAKMLLKRPDIQPNAANADGYTALIVASQNGYGTIVGMFLERPDILPNAVTNAGYTALMFTLQNGHEVIAEMLLERLDIQLNAVTHDGDTALILASLHGHEAIARMLLKDPNIQPNVANRKGDTALIVTSRRGCEATARMLLERLDIQPNATDMLNHTALMYASKNGHEGIAKMLLERPDVQPNVVAYWAGWTALMYALQSGRDAIARMLLKRPDIQPNATTKFGYTALMLASQNGHEAIARMLLERLDAQPNAMTHDGDTALIFASLHGYESIARMLLGLPNIKLDAANQLDEALIFAAQHGHEAIARMLLGQPDIQPNAVSKNGYTALMLASRGGHEAIVRMLLERTDIHPNATSKNGFTAVMLASREGHETIIRMLRKRLEQR